MLNLNTLSPSTTSVGNCLILRSSHDLSGDYLNQLKTLATEGVYKNKFLYVIFDLSELKFIDMTEFRDLKAIFKMVKLLGSDFICSGMHPAIIAHLVSNDVDLKDIKATLDLDDALKKFGIINVR